MAKEKEKRSHDLKPGDRVTSGVAVHVDDDGAWLGREVEEHEPLPPGHTEHRFGKTRVFLSKDQARFPHGHEHLTPADD